ncbi:MAG: GtrA family protein [Phenylobacterium sp.]
MLRRATILAGRHPQVRQLVIFGIIGVAATAAQAAIALWTHARIGLQPVVANGLGYVCSCSLSYLANAWWTFQRPALHGPTFLRYVGVSAAGLAFSEALTFLCADLLGWPFAFALIPALTLAPLLSFVLSKTYAFADRETVGQAR